jgi:hypothetical protein
VHAVVDGPQGFFNSVPPIWEATSAELAIVRLRGGNAETWNLKGPKSSAERFNYLYSADRVRDLGASIRTLSRQAKRTHVLFNNYGDYAQRNALQMRELLAPGTAGLRARLARAAEAGLAGEGDQQAAAAPHIGAAATEPAVRAACLSLRGGSARRRRDFPQEGSSTPMPGAAAANQTNGTKREWCTESLVDPDTLSVRDGQKHSPDTQHTPAASSNCSTGATEQHSKGATMSNATDRTNRCDT